MPCPGRILIAAPIDTWLSFTEGPQGEAPAIESQFGGLAMRGFLLVLLPVLMTGTSALHAELAPRKPYTRTVAIVVLTASRS